MKCPRCGDLNWNPVLACKQCPFSIEFKLQNPSDYQREKWVKHGLIYEEGVGTLVNPDAWTKRETGGSIFTPETDISSIFTIVASSGCMVIPQSASRENSYIFYLAKPIGGGYLAGKWDYFYGVRIVQPQSEEKIHLFPDTIRSAVDRELICPNCSKAYRIENLPKVCGCGRTIS